MTTTPRADHAVPVEQVDRDAGADLYELVSFGRPRSSRESGMLRSGASDASSFVQAFASHRLAAAPKPAIPDQQGHVADAVRDACRDVLEIIVSFDQSEQIAEAVIAHVGTIAALKPAMAGSKEVREAVADIINEHVSSPNFYDDQMIANHHQDQLAAADAILALIGAAEGRAVSECAREAAQALWDDGHDAIGGEAADASLFAEQRHVAVMTSYIERTRRQDDVLRKAAQALLAQFDKYRESDLNHECAHRYLANDWRRWDDLRAALSTPEEQER